MRKADVTLVRDNRPSITDKFMNIIHFKTHFVPSAFLSFLLKIIRSMLLCRVTIRKNNNLSVVAFGLVNVIRFDFYAYTQWIVYNKSAQLSSLYSFKNRQRNFIYGSGQTYGKKKRQNVEEFITLDFLAFRNKLKMYVNKMV